MMDDEKYMKEAIKLARKAFNKNEIPVGAIIVKDGVIIAKGYNKKNNSNLTTDHAEIIAITKANKKLNNWRLDGCTIYITLEPCPMCASAIEQARISRIVTSSINNKQENRKIVSSILKNKDWKKHFLIDQSEDIINEFFKLRR